jgi:hypothetical protein
MPASTLTIRVLLGSAGDRRAGTSFAADRRVQIGRSRVRRRERDAAPARPPSSERIIASAMSLTKSCRDRHRWSRGSAATSSTILRFRAGRAARAILRSGDARAVQALPRGRKSPSERLAAANATSEMVLHPGRDSREHGAAPSAQPRRTSTAGVPKVFEPRDCGDCARSGSYPPREVTPMASPSGSKCLHVGEVQAAVPGSPHHMFQKDPSRSGVVHVMISYGSLMSQPSAVHQFRH